MTEIRRVRKERPVVGAYRGRVRRVVAHRPGWDAIAAWADGSLVDTLTMLGADRALPVGRTAPLVLTWADQAMEIWQGGRRPSPLIGVEWHEVVAIHAVDGFVGTLAMHAIALELRSGVRLVLCPSRRSTGGVSGASSDQIDVLVEHLRRRIPSPTWR